MAPFHRLGNRDPEKTCPREETCLRSQGESGPEPTALNTGVADNYYLPRLNQSEEQSQGPTGVALPVGSTHLPVSEPDSSAVRWEDSPNNPTSSWRFKSQLPSSWGKRYHSELSFYLYQIGIIIVPALTVIERMKPWKFVFVLVNLSCSTEPG